MGDQLVRWRHHFQGWVSTHRWRFVIISAVVYAVLVGLIPGLYQRESLTQILIAMGTWGALGLLVFSLLLRPRGVSHPKNEPHRTAKRGAQSHGSKKPRRSSRGSRRH